MNYFLLSWKEDDFKDYAKSPKGILSHELIDKMKGKELLPFELPLEADTPKDYQSNGLAWPMMSEKMKDIINNNLSGLERIDWIKCYIIYQDKKLTYYILRFNSVLDVLDEKLTTYVPGTDSIIRPCYSMKKIEKYAIFPKPAGALAIITHSIVVSEKLKKAIENEGITGVDFSKVRTI